MYGDSEELLCFTRLLGEFRGKNAVKFPRWIILKVAASPFEYVCIRVYVYALIKSQLILPPALSAGVASKTLSAPDMGLKLRREQATFPIKSVLYVFYKFSSSIINIVRHNLPM